MSATLTELSSRPLVDAIRVDMPPASKWIASDADGDEDSSADADTELRTKDSTLAESEAAPIRHPIRFLPTKYLMCVAVPFILSVLFLLVPLKYEQRAANDTTGADRQVSYWSFVFVYQGVYGLGGAAMVGVVFESALPASGRRNVLITLSMLPVSVLAIWFMFLCQYLLDPFAIRQKLIHTLAPLALNVPYFTLYFTRAYKLYKKGPVQCARALSSRKNTSAASRKGTASDARLENREALLQNEHSSMLPSTSSPSSATGASSSLNGTTPTAADELPLSPTSEFVVELELQHDPSRISFLRSAPFAQWFTQCILVVCMLTSFFFCQWSAMEFRNFQREPPAQLFVFVLFSVVIFGLKSVMQLLARQMDQRSLPELTIEECSRRPSISSMVDAIQQLFYFLFYRTLFSSIETPSVFAIMMILHCGQEVALYPLRMTEAFHSRWCRFADWVLQHTLPLKPHGKSGFLVRWLHRRQPLEELQMQLCLEYVSRSLSFFASMFMFVFLSAFWWFSSYNGHDLYIAFNETTDAFWASMTFTACAFIVEAVCFVLVQTLSQRLVNFPFFCPWSRQMLKPLAIISFIAAATHITTDVCIARFRADAITTW